MPRRFLHPRARDDELREVYRDKVGAVYAFFSYSVSHDTAEDLTAATFERVVRSWSRFDPGLAGPRTWLMAIARNILADHFRRQTHRRTVSLDEHHAGRLVGLQRRPGGASPEHRHRTQLAGGARTASATC